VSWTPFAGVLGQRSLGRPLTEEPAKPSRWSGGTGRYGVDKRIVPSVIALEGALDSSHSLSVSEKLESLILARRCPRDPRIALNT
jgi:hypothetical protein